MQWSDHTIALARGFLNGTIGSERFRYEAHLEAESLRGVEGKALRDSIKGYGYAELRTFAEGILTS